jgi:hyperosmotically inducible protein
MSWRKTCILYPCVAAAFLLMAIVPAGAQSGMAAPDNSKTNKGDQSSSAMTADQQKNNRSDLDITKEIRRSLTQDKSLSTYAHNVKVITQDGKVTLKGPVRTDDEKSTVVAKATQVAGQGNVSDELTVAPKSH